jgi:hypothetical protein
LDLLVSEGLSALNGQESGKVPDSPGCVQILHLISHFDGFQEPAIMLSPHFQAFLKQGSGLCFQLPVSVFLLLLRINHHSVPSACIATLDLLWLLDNGVDLQLRLLSLGDLVWR